MRQYNLDYMDKTAYMQAINEATDFIRARVAQAPQIALVLGSGLGAFAEKMENPTVLSFEEIPHFPKPTVEGHGGKMFFGRLAGKNVVIMQGRYHYYEGYDTQTITLPIWIFKKLGVESIVLTNACGGINKHFKAGDLMILEDHIANFCPSPMRGVHLDEFGPRFTDMSRVYDPEYRRLAEEVAEESGFKIQKGIYAFWQGPTYETPAEVRAYQALDADAVGMSTVAEAAVAVNCGMRVLGISCITNMTSLLSKTVTSHEEVIEMGKKVAGRFTQLLEGVVEKM